MAAAERLQDSVEFLFHPGSGSDPPVLAGREKETKSLDRFRRALLRGKKIDRDAVLYGPRGNGKTVLLNKFCQTCRETMPESGTVALVPASRLKSVGDFRAELFPKGFVRELGRRIADAVSIGISSVQVGFGDSGKPRLANILRARLKKGPLILAIDEAHTLPVDLGHDLLNESQSLRAEGLPFFLVLAGTPDIKAKLGQMEASFWGRSKIIPLGCISDEDAKRALTEPLDALGVHFSTGALALAEADMVGYPYFTQLWGESLAHTKDDFDRRPKVSVADAATASRLFARERWHYYDERWRELMQRNLVAPAATVARAWRASEVRDEVQLRSIVKEALAQGDDTPDMNAEDTVREMFDLGFLWDAGGAPDGREGSRVKGLEAGIPSLMDHILERAPAPREEPLA